MADEDPVPREDDALRDDDTGRTNLGDPVSLGANQEIEQFDESDDTYALRVGSDALDTVLVSSGSGKYTRRVIGFGGGGIGDVSRYNTPPTAGNKLARWYGTGADIQGGTVEEDAVGNLTLVKSITGDGTSDIAGFRDITASRNIAAGGYVLIENLGLRVKDTDSSTYLNIVPGSNLSVPRTLNIITGDADRNVTIAGDATIIGNNTGDQTITLSGDVSGTGTGAITTAIGALKVTNAMLAGNIDLTTKVTGILPGTNGGTGVNNSTRTITVAGNFATSGAFAVTLTATGTTNVTLPTSGTLVNTAVTSLTSLTAVGTIVTGVWNATPITMTYGGTGANLTASNGGIIYSGASAMAVLAGTATANKMLLSGSSAAPTWSTSTIPTSAGATAGKVLISDGTNYILSTPTFPNASATSGKFIRSDGTNWIASTPTLPTTAGSSGKFLVSDGTNWVSSTPTVPSTAGSSGKFLQSDGTNWIQSTLLFPTSGMASTGSFLWIGASANTFEGSQWNVPTGSLTANRIFYSSGTTQMSQTANLTWNEATLGLTGDLAFGAGAARSISVGTAAAAGNDLTISAGIGTGIVYGGNLNLYGGAGFGGSSVFIAGANAFGGGPGAVYINATAGTTGKVAMGASAAATTEILSIGLGGTQRGSVRFCHGAGGNTPGYWAIGSRNGTIWYIFITDAGVLRYHNAIPANNTDGTAV